MYTKSKVRKENMEAHKDLARHPKHQKHLKRI